MDKRKVKSPITDDRLENQQLGRPYRLLTLL